MLKFISACGAHLTTAQKSGLGKWDVFQDSVVDPTGGIDGGACFQSGLSAYTRVRCVKKVSLSPANEVIFGWRHYVDTTFPLTGFAGYLIAAIHYGGGGSYFNSTKQISLNITTDGRLYFTRGSWDGPVLGTATRQLLSLTWTFIEVKAVIHPTAGSLLLHVDDEVYLNLTGINTQGLGTTSIDAVEYIPWGVDDVYIMDTTAVAGNPYVDFFGSRFRVIPNRMESENSVQWTPPGGMTNIDGINDSTPDGRSNIAGSVGLTDLYVPTPLPLSVATVLAVQSNISCISDGSASVADVTKIDSTTYEGPANSMPALEKDQLTLMASAPDDGLAWTREKYNASLRGYKRTA